jgi:hypothetical protein
MGFFAVWAHYLWTMKKIFQALRMSELDSSIAKGQSMVAKAALQPLRGVPAAAASSPVSSSTRPATAPSLPGQSRVQKRSKLLIPTLLRPAEPEQDGNFEETLTTENVSRNGLYLGNARQPYREGMRLLVTFPSSAGNPALVSEYDAQVVRVDRPENSPAGIAVLLFATRTVALAS